MEFAFDGQHVRVFPAKTSRPNSRGARLAAQLRGSADTTMATDEIMALTRAE